MNQIIIKIATIDDLDMLFYLMQRQFDEHQIEYEPGKLVRAIKEMLTKQELGFFMVAAKQDQVIGFAAISYAWTLEHGGKTAWLDELYVLPEQRSLGTGSLLVESLIAETKRLGCLAIDLEVEQDHQRAERLYARKGFEKLNRRRWAKQLK